MKPLWNWQRLLQEVSKMVKFYVNRIRNGRMTIEEVPDRWRDAVAEELEATE